MKIGFIGAGRVGFTLGKYFKEHGADVSGYHSRDPNSAREAAGFTNTEYFATLEQVVMASDVLFITVPDTMIGSVWSSLKTLSIANKLICHCSGVLSSGVFDQIDQKQAYGYSVHPFFAIASKRTSYQEISQAFFTLEGNGKYLHTLKQFIEHLGNPVHIITERQKIKYHAAAVFLSNHLAALATTGSKLLAECGFGEEFIAGALKTLFLYQCMDIANNGPEKALTGPLERNDQVTVQKHMECLEKNERQLYGLLSKQLIEIAKKKHPDSDYTKMDALITKEMGISE